MTSSLPSQPTSFVGRTSELAIIARLLADPTLRAQWLDAASVRKAFAL